MDIPGIGTLTENEYGELRSARVPLAAFGGADGVFVLEGYSDDPHPEDFHVAIRNMLEAQPILLEGATPYLHQYYLDCAELLGDELPSLDIHEPADVWKHVDLNLELAVMRDHGSGREVFLSVSGSCAWEPEHGLQLVFEDGRKVSKVGPYDGHVSNVSAFDDPRLAGVVYRR